MNEQRHPHKRFSTLSIWAMSFGCSVGWGAFVLPGTTFLPAAGPLGTTLGLFIGALAMVLIAANYHFMAQRYPNAGGAFSYVRALLGADHAFLCAWFLWLVYAAIIWANATAFTILFRNFLGNFFQFGFHYNLAGYEVYAGEILMTMLIIAGAGLLCMYRNRYAIYVNTIFALILLIASVGSFLALDTQLPSLSNLGPAFVPGVPVTGQIVAIMAFAPWAYVGFEAVSHVSYEMKKGSNRLFWLMSAGALTGALVYAVITLIGAAPLKDLCDWQCFASQMQNHDSTKTPSIVDLVVLQSITQYLGPTGLKVLSLAAFGGIATGLIGFFLALSRLTCAVAEDGILPTWFAKRTSRGIPKNAFIFIISSSIFISFAGRSAIGWIVDLTTICATLVYTYVSLVTILQAKREQDTWHMLTGILGVILGLVFCLCAFLPNIWSISVLAPESYFIFAIWAIIGFIFILYLFKRDKTERYGKSTIVWLTMLTVIFGSTLMWMRQDVHEITSAIVNNITLFHEQRADVQTKEQDPVLSTLQEKEERKQFLRKQLDTFNHELIEHSIIQLLIIILSIYIMFRVFSLMNERRQKVEVEKLKAEEISKSKSTFLSNMSHDIRTPMNAIIGFTDLALTKKDINLIYDYLRKIKLSSNHLLSLINDVLEMSRIESGRIELQATAVNLPDLLYNLTAIIIGQIADKKHSFDIYAIDVKDEEVICDKLRLNQILLNLLSNAIKYTPDNGKIQVTLTQLDHHEDTATYQLSVKDNGYGMSPEFAARIFESFERENTETINKIQGTGLGMSITKHLVDLMGGDIKLITQKDLGSEFIITLTLPLVATKDQPELPLEHLQNLKVLLVGSDEHVLKGIQGILQDLNSQVTQVETAREAILVQEQSTKHAEAFDIYLIDWQLQDGSGIDLAHKLSQSSAGSQAKIVLITGYDWLDIKDEAVKAGVKAFCHRPIFASALQIALAEAMGHKATSSIEESVETQDFTGKRVLLVDDIDVNREIALTVLEMHGLNVEEAENGQVALDKVQKAAAGYYDLILMDMQMPVMNGMDATKAIRALPDKAKANVPIVAMTANAFEEDRQNALACGMNGHIAKPIDVNKVLETLKELMTKP